MKPFSRYIILSILVSALWLMSCGTAQQYVAPITDIDDRVAVTAVGDFDSLVAEGDAHWENRGDQAELEAAIVAWETAIHVDITGDRYEVVYPLLAKLSRAYYFLGDTHIRLGEGTDDEIEAMMKETFQLAIEMGRLGLSINNEEWNRALLYETPIPEAVNVMTLSDVPAAYWYSVAMGKWALLDGTPTILAHKDDIAAIMGRIAELDREFFYGASDRYFGLFWTKLPLGNPDLESSLLHFEASIAAAPYYLATRVLYASAYATKTQDRELYIEQLEYVLACDLDLAPEIRPENEMEQLKAQEWLDNVDEYFR